MIKRKPNFKKGATSIYVVVIATLLFSVITVSFIRIVINETAKTTSDELAQSAYDSALAGVEDSKTALKQYFECRASLNGSNPEEGSKCQTVINSIETGFASADPSSAKYGYCDAVSEALGRISAGEDKEVLIREETTSSSDVIDQAYTCVIINNVLDDYRAELDSGTTIRVIPLKTTNPTSITGIRISWFIEDDGSFDTLNFAYPNNSNKFTPISNGTPTPPTLSAQIIQTAPSFGIDDFENSVGNSTNRGTVFLVPTNETTASSHVTRDVVVASNNHSSDRTSSNAPHKVPCGKDNGLSEEFACVASIELPGPVNASTAAGFPTARNGETFFLVLSLPYGQPTTHFSVQLCTDNEAGGIRGDCRNDTNSTAKFTDAQISIDSTGRANDMYSRVEARVEFGDIHFPFPEFAVQATGSDDDSIKKNFYVTQNCFISSAGDVETCSNTGDAPE
ncbi:hypothetical protein IKE71_00675 [Candidatus Saccharibacteria bacterium]|nr:hypothetical protein [Candidatus Saccharibacteria bacterium]